MVNMQYWSYLPCLAFKRETTIVGDITNCLPALDVLLANENDCIILKDNNTDRQK